MRARYPPKRQQARADIGLDERGYDGILEPGMVLCVEAYVGAVGAKNGVKLEDQVLITDTGYENLTTYPFEESFLGSGEV